LAMGLVFALGPALHVRAEDSDMVAFLANAEFFGSEIGHAVFCEIEKEKLDQLVQTGMPTYLPTLDNAKKNMTLEEAFESAMRKAAESGPEQGCESFLEEVLGRLK